MSKTYGIGLVIGAGFVSGIVGFGVGALVDVSYLAPSVYIPTEVIHSDIDEDGFEDIIAVRKDGLAKYIFFGQEDGGFIRKEDRDRTERNTQLGKQIQSEADLKSRVDTLIKQQKRR